jgi:hypothetical protein
LITQTNKVCVVNHIFRKIILKYKQITAIVTQTCCKHNTLKQHSLNISGIYHTEKQNLLCQQKIRFNFNENGSPNRFICCPDRKICCPKPILSVASVVTIDRSVQTTVFGRSEDKPNFSVAQPILLRCS